GLEKLHGDFCTSEHFDRWAVLVDSVVYEKNLLRREEEDRCGLHLVQHGSLTKLDKVQQEPGLAFVLKYKLRAVSDLYAYDNASEMVFRRDILCAESLENLRVYYYSPQIQLAKTEHAARFSILFVGHPICEAMHVKAFEILRQAYSELTFYYKPHPTALPSASIRRYEWTVI